ncbi:MAG: hypothetical protein A2Z20_05645 [Bdellovibrionales bacterium RBG_16_40_8]|nr:MAG: hypothetical protein A2Z20_05645 [Bdellovibrionales bacterium RBG_16_40_8]
MIEELFIKHNEIYNKNMRTPHNNKHLQPSTYSQRSTTYVDRDFQVKYTRYILGMAILSTFIFLLPALYFSNQNYFIFYQLADLLSPDLANYIAKERIGFNAIFAITFIVNIIFWAVFSKKMTAKIAGPAKILRNHMRLLSRGDFTLPPVRLREDDEFKELVNAYNYLFILWKVQSERELEELREIQSSITNPAVYETVRRMIRERTLRLNPNPKITPAPAPVSSDNTSSTTSSHDGGPAASRGSRHAS